MHFHCYFEKAKCFPAHHRYVSALQSVNMIAAGRCVQQGKKAGVQKEETNAIVEQRRSGYNCDN